jgi:hypothetical protein
LILTVDDPIRRNFALIRTKEELREEKGERVLKSGKHILSRFFVLLLFCWSMNAQQTSSLRGSATVPRLVNFSGKAKDTSGKIISGIADATFAIYKKEFRGARFSVLIRRTDR